MSTQIKRKIICPECGAAAETPLWAGITADDNPELREKVLDETLFDWKCPECEYSARFLYPCLYHDKKLGFMVYAVPEGCGKAPGPDGICEKFPQLSGVKKRLVNSPARLKEKVLIFEAGLDDLAVELVKLAMADVLKNKYGKKVETCYFCYADKDNNQIGFSFFLEGEKEPIRRRTKMNAYEKTLEIAGQAGLSDGGDFLSVDSDFANKVLAEYKG